MKILQINTTSYFSTGAIVNNIQNGLKDEFDFYVATTDCEGEKTHRITGNKLVRNIGKVFSQIDGSDGFHYRAETKKMLKWIDKVNPDIIHLHNIHCYYANLELILKYAYSKNIPIVFTMHDCWSFTGRCAHFDNVSCNKWKEGCGNCHYKDSYPRTRFFDASSKYWLKKKELLVGHSIHFVTPSEWLKGFAKLSFLKNEDIRVINNGIDVSIYDSEDKDFVLPDGIDPKKKMILSVAYPFTNEKGLKDINELANLIDKDKYQIVCVGVTDEYKTEEGIVRIAPTTDKQFIANLYKKAEVVCLFTHQDNYPTVLLEAVASGTPCVSYDVGGVKEIVVDGQTGYTVTEDDVVSAYNKILEISKINRKKCKEIGQQRSIENFVKKYKELYLEILK